MRTLTLGFFVLLLLTAHQAQANPVVSAVGAVVSGLAGEYAIRAADAAHEAAKAVFQARESAARAEQAERRLAEARAARSFDDPSQRVELVEVQGKNKKKP